jgi:hypothetical protein
VSLEELALLLERVDYSSGRLEDIEAMRFWNHLQASSELLEALGCVLSVSLLNSTLPSW